MIDIYQFSLIHCFSFFFSIKANRSVGIIPIRNDRFAVVGGGV